MMQLIRLLNKKLKKQITMLFKKQLNLIKKKKIKDWKNKQKDNKN